MHVGEAKMIKATILCMALFVPSARASAQSTIDGNSYVPICGAPNGTFSDGVCFGFVKGVVGGVDLQRYLDSNSVPVFCSPSGVTYGQEEDIFRKYLVDHPERRHLPASELVIESMQTAFPCGRK